MPIPRSFVTLDTFYQLVGMRPDTLKPSWKPSTNLGFVLRSYYIAYYLGCGSWR